MRQRRISSAAVVLWSALAACAEPSPAPRRPDSARTTAVAPSASSTPPLALPGVGPGAVQLAVARPDPLPYGIVPVDGADAVLAVSDASSEQLGFAQRVDATGTLGPPFALMGHHVAAAFDVEGATVLLTTLGRSLCVSEVQGGALRPRRCHDGLRVDAAVRGADGIALVSADLPVEDDSDPAVRAKRDKAEKEEARRKKERDKRERDRKRSGSKRKEDRPRSDKATDVLARRKLEITTRRLGWDGALDDAPIEAGVTFEEPMSGMGIVGAAARRSQAGLARIDVAFHEWSGTITDRTSKAVGRARIGTATLDEKGALVEGARGKLADSDLYFGFLADTLEPRLAGLEGGTVLLAQGSARGPCQATVIAPARAPMIGDRAVCGFDPGRYVTRASELRSRAKPAPNEVARSAPAFEAMAAKLAQAGAHRAEGQPEWDPLRAVTLRHGFTIQADGELAVFDRETFAVTTVSRPLVARRSRAFGIGFAADGAAAIVTDEGMRLVSATDGVTAVPSPTPGPARADDAVGGATFTRIGDGWWTTRPPHRRVHPAPHTPIAASASIEASVLVGDGPRGLLVEVDGDALVVTEIGADGESTRLSRSASPIRGGIDAIAIGDGALVVGPSRTDPGTWVAVRVDAKGAWASTPVGERKRALVPRLTSVFGRAVRMRTSTDEPVRLLDERGAVLDSWIKPPSSGSCVDGEPWPARLPGPRPGTFVELPALASGDVCVVGEPMWSTSGELRAVVSRRVGPHLALELARYRPKPDELRAPDEVPAAPPAPAPKASTAPARCPSDMVLVDGRLCVDRFEAAIADGKTGRLVSPDFPITPNLFASVAGDWATKRERVGDLFARAMPTPRPLPFQLLGVDTPRATSRSGVLPSGYLTGLIAKDVCAAARKRLCTKSEFEIACKGEKKTRFPYGESYREGACNVARPGHPAAILHGHASVGHLDPRLGRVVLDETGTGLRATGATPTCTSRWGGDAIYDMVGNLDEWLDEKGGAFAGGFYARGSKSGCDALVDSHPPSYLDYSTGVRCCRDAG